MGLRSCVHNLRASASPDTQDTRLRPAASSSPQTAAQQAQKRSAQTCRLIAPYLRVVRLSEGVVEAGQGWAFKKSLHRGVED